ncbi:POTRA domain-containing protein [Sphingomonas sp. MMS24-JH45]
MMHGPGIHVHRAGGGPGRPRGGADRAHPRRSRRLSSARCRPRRRPRPRRPPPRAPRPVVADATQVGMVRAITVDGQDRLPPSTFAHVIARAVGQEMTRADLTALAGAIAEAARTRGYPFATAQVPPQRVADGILRVTLDLGRIDAVRVVGARSIAADRDLGETLTTGAPVRRQELDVRRRWSATCRGCASPAAGWCGRTGSGSSSSPSSRIAWRAMPRPPIAAVARSGRYVPR